MIFKQISCIAINIDFKFAINFYNSKTRCDFQKLVSKSYSTPNTNSYMYNKFFFGMVIW